MEFWGNSLNEETYSKREVASSMGIASRSPRERGSKRNPCMDDLEPVVTLQRVASRVNRGQTGASREQMRK